MVIHQTMTKDDDEEISTTAKSAIEEATPQISLYQMQGRDVLANDGGRTLLQQIQDGQQELKTRVSRLESLGNLFIDVRERAFLTYLRDG